MIVPSIDLMDGRAVQLVQGKKLEIDAGDPRPLAERFGMVGEVAVIDLDAALGRGDNAAVIRELLDLAPCRVGGGIRTTEQAMDWLDAGARKVILGTAARPDVLDPLPADRTIAALDALHGDVVVEGWTKGTGASVDERIADLEGLVGGFLVTFVEVEGTLGGFPLERAEALAEIAGAARVTFAGGIRGVDELAALDRVGADAQVGMALYTDRLDLADAFAAPLVSDRPDGLWPTVVEDASGRVMGLAWSDAESLRTAIRERRGVYRSRSRGLWRKGETSGATQELLAVRADCDRDALLFTVRQRGSGFCHTGTAGCFEAPPAPGRFSLASLEDRVRERWPSAPVGDAATGGSLTARLAADPALLSGKLLEEAGELAEADGAAEAVSEFADLFYFALARLVSAGGSLEEVESELARRALKTRRRAPRAPAPPARGPAPAPGGSPESKVGAGGLLPLRTIDEAGRIVRDDGDAADADAVAGEIVEDVRARGERAVREHALRLGDIDDGETLECSRADLERARAALDEDAVSLLERTAKRIGAFARAQLDTATGLDVAVPGGRAGHRLEPVAAAGCYAPGGRHPLPSSVLMTAVPARVAGVPSVWVASPRPTTATLAAAAVAGADGVLAVGGAQAIAALAFGVGGPPPSDVIAGPGNRYVTAAKRYLYGEVGIDMLAGPSELLMVADASSRPETIAADLLAQAEHDPLAVPLACVPSEEMAGAVRAAVARRLEDLPTRDTAERAARRGGIVVADDDEAIVRLIETVRPEHLHLADDVGARLEDRVRRYGALFLGDRTPEVFGDYGAGPNHTLPTGGTAGFSDGLSVFTFLRRPTWLRLDPDSTAYRALASDSAALARLEGLEAHARAAELRGAPED